MPTTLFGPATVSVPDVYTASPDPASYDETLANVVLTFTAASGDVITCSFASATQSAGGPDFDCFLKRSGTPAQTWAGSFFAQPTAWASVAGGSTASFTITASGTYEILLLDGGNGVNAQGGTGTLSAFTVTTSAASTAYCAYGVQANPDATAYQLVTDTLIDVVVAAALIGTANAEWVPFVETFLGAIEGAVFITVNCATFPTGNTVLDFTNPQTITRENILAWFQQAAWHFFCQCVPAPPLSPDPITPPKPPVIPPGGVSTTQPPVLCDNTDLCTFLSAIKNEVEQLLAQVSYLRTDVQLIQRQKVPFAYVPATLHTGLNGSGQFAVQGILGLAVQVTTVPGASGEEAGDPIARFGLGWVTTGTADGWRKSVPIRANPQWIDVEPDDTLIGYSLGPLVVANIEEFAREP